jgi:hypothetical protein
MILQQQEERAVSGLDKPVQELDAAIAISDAVAVAEFLLELFGFVSGAERVAERHGLLGIDRTDAERCPLKRAERRARRIAAVPVGRKGFEQSFEKAHGSPFLGVRQERGGFAWQSSFGILNERVFYEQPSQGPRSILCTFGKAGRE